MDELVQLVDAYLTEKIERSPLMMVASKGLDFLKTNQRGKQLMTDLGTVRIGNLDIPQLPIVYWKSVLIADDKDPTCGVWMELASMSRTTKSLDEYANDEVIMDMDGYVWVTRAARLIVGAIKILRYVMDSYLQQGRLQFAKFVKDSGYTQFGFSEDIDDPMYEIGHQKLERGFSEFAGLYIDSQANPSQDNISYIPYQKTYSNQKGEQVNLFFYHSHIDIYYFTRLVMTITAADINHHFNGSVIYRTGKFINISDQDPIVYIQPIIRSKLNQLRGIYPDCGSSNNNNNNNNNGPVIVLSPNMKQKNQNNNNNGPVIVLSPKMKQKNQNNNNNGPVVVLSPKMKQKNQNKNQNNNNNGPAIVLSPNMKRKNQSNNNNNNNNGPAIVLSPKMKQKNQNNNNNGPVIVLSPNMKQKNQSNNNNNNNNNNNGPAIVLSPKMKQKNQNLNNNNGSAIVLNAKMKQKKLISSPSSSSSSDGSGDERILRSAPLSPMNGLNNSLNSDRSLVRTPSSPNAIVLNRNLKKSQSLSSKSSGSESENNNGPIVVLRRDMKQKKGTKNNNNTKNSAAVRNTQNNQIATIPAKKIANPPQKQDEFLSADDDNGGAVNNNNNSLKPVYAKKEKKKTAYILIQNAGSGPDPVTMGPDTYAAMCWVLLNRCQTVELLNDDLNKFKESYIQNVNKVPVQFYNPISSRNIAAKTRKGSYLAQIYNMIDFFITLEINNGRSSQNAQQMVVNRFKNFCDQIKLNGVNNGGDTREYIEQEIVRLIVQPGTNYYMKGGENYPKDGYRYFEADRKSRLEIRKEFGRLALMRYDAIQKLSSLEKERIETDLFDTLLQVSRR